MSLNITNSVAVRPYAPSRDKCNHSVADMTATVMTKLAEQQQQATVQLGTAFDAAETRVAKVEEFANANDYSHLATFARKVTDGLTAAEQHFTAGIAHRFEVKERLVENRPAGGYEISEADAAELSAGIQQRTDARISSFNEKTASISERLDNLEQHALSSGHDGTRISEFADTLESRREGMVERTEIRSDKMLALIQRRISETYSAPVETSLANEA
jgi:hypothetical protein